MGGLLEALWGYNTNLELNERHHANYEIAWFPGHHFHDFALLEKDSDWDPVTKRGELFRIEVKSMNFGADESKAHFDVLHSELDDYDGLLLLVWDWALVDHKRHYPRIRDSFFSLAHPIAQLRDSLHDARNGSFVDRERCPDQCHPSLCAHHGEPLNENGKRERLSGPESCRPSSKVSYAANFGGLVRMLKTRGAEAKRVFRQIRHESDVADQYIEFIHRNFPDEERNHYSKPEWQSVALKLGIDPDHKELTDLHEEIRSNPGYLEILKELQ